MANELENANSLNSKFPYQELEGLEGDALQEKLKELGSKYENISETNKQLFVRAKKAEGFEQNENGEWVKIHQEKKPASKKEEKSDEFDYGQLSYLVAKGVSDEDKDFTQEKWKGFRAVNPDGKLEDLLANDFFKKSLEGRVTERGVRNALPQEQGRGSGGAHDSEELAWQKYQATGKLPQGKENSKLRAKLAHKRWETEKIRDEGPDVPIVGHYAPK